MIGVRSFVLPLNIEFAGGHRPSRRGENPTPQSLRRGQFCGAPKLAARARQSAATAASALWVSALIRFASPCAGFEPLWSWSDALYFCGYQQALISETKYFEADHKRLKPIPLRRLQARPQRFRVANAGVAFGLPPTRHMPRQERSHQTRDHIAIFFQREMACIQEMQFRLG